MKWKDPIVEEVHDIRRQMMAEFGNDFHKLCEYLRAKEKEHPERYVSVEELKARQMAVAETRASYGKAGPKKRGE